MTTTKYSPAPWGYQYNPYTVRPVGCDSAGTELPAYEILDAEGNKVFDTNEDTPGELQEANACLGAAAPAMLAALRLAQEALNTAPRFRVGDTDSYRIAASVDKAIEQATAAGAMPEPHGTLYRERTPDRTASAQTAPWSLHFDRDGTEDVAVICDGDGNDLLTSRHFWLLEKDDPVPPTLAFVRVAAVAPKLLNALEISEGFVQWALDHGADRTATTAAIDYIRAVLAEAKAQGEPPLPPEPSEAGEA